MHATVTKAQFLRKLAYSNGLLQTNVQSLKMQNGFSLQIPKNREMFYLLLVYI